ncbi:AF4/FMR2 family member 4 isoform X2 [Drosophila navojoa]|uniref:AF4/FMR2 family member 4 isoform X2 n=1 Tax=Drosophila navojoa TaxID=7232 RepID=UPI0008479AAB|nr:AF4/FMR2 family member 4 isoform X2 [Drosophila navojoa]
MVNVPPLLCSTPPPIDFGEDDDDSGLQSTLQLEDGEADEYSEYGLVTDTHNTSFNTKVSELPELPISAEYIAQSQPPDLSIGPAKTEKATVEAFNYQVKAVDTEISEGHQMSPKHIEALAPVAERSELDVEVEQPPMVDDEEEEANTNDNVPSLKLDSLSLYSSGSATPPSTLSPVADEQTTKAPPVCHQVTLEDVTDDSDDECSPKKPKELFIPEGAPDFFAIELIETPTQQASALNNQFPEAKPEPEISTCTTTDVADSNEVPPQEINIKVEEAKSQEALSDDDDFGDFADFSPAPAVVETEQAANEDDGFDDFQDFVTPATTTMPTPEDDSDDDFGDFAEPTFDSAPPAAAPVLPQPPPPAAAHLSIDERVKPVLEIMFPKVESSCAQQACNQRPLAEAQTLHFGAIEQAHALNYQWSSSEMRHSLVRSLAIDSRNILFGDKWNASMPRFAANLSFDPLKPLKPQAVPGSNSSLLSVSNSSSTQLPFQGLEATAAAATAATSQSQTKAQPSPADGQIASSSDEATAVVSGACSDDGPAAASIFAAAAATAPLSPALSADGHGNHFDDTEQLPPQQQQQQQQLDLRGESLLPSPSPSPPPALATVVNSQQLHEITSCNSSTSSSSINNNNNSFSLPLKETHIYTPSKSDTVVAKTTTLAPIDFDYEIASAGIIIDETVVKKEYRDVEYKPPFGLDSPTKPSSAGKPAAEDDDFSDFQSVPAVKNVAQLQPPRNGTPTFGEHMILSPAILLPQSIPLAKPTIEWGDNAQASINADELARIEELFSHQYKPPTISASVAQQSPKQHQHQQQQQQTKQHQEDDEWSDFVSVPVQQQQQQQQPQQIKHNNNNAQKARKAAPIAAAVQKDDDWSDFVSSTPLPARAAPQFNSGAWQSANFYNNPLSLYQQQQQPHSHSNLVPKYQSNNTSSSNNNNNSNNNNIPQQIHMMHDFSTAPTPTGNAVSYQHQHHQHHQQQLQQQQQQQQHQHHRQQFHLSNAKVAPRISLIPDLSFVAPALPANAGAFMSSLPKPSFSAKK